MGGKLIKHLNMFLIIINSILLFIYSIHGIQNGLQALFSLIVFAVLLIISSTYHLILWLIIRKRTLSWMVRTPLYLLPMIIILISLLFPANLTELPNQKSKLISPSKQYTMNMDMEHNRWIVSISDTNGKLLYRDNNSDFVGHLNVYWIWDDKDRLWLFNSDDSRIYYWIPISSTWKKNLWSDEKNSKQDDFSPPMDLYPDYAKKN